MCQSLYEYINAENQRHVRRLQIVIENQAVIADYEDAGKSIGLPVAISPLEMTGELAIWLQGDLSHISNKERAPIDLDHRDNAYLIAGRILALHYPNNKGANDSKAMA